MPSQEDRLLIRIAQTKAYIGLKGPVHMDKLQAWGMVTLGLRARTMRQYVNALMLMDVIDIQDDMISLNKSNVEEEIAEK